MEKIPIQSYAEGVENGGVLLIGGKNLLNH